MKTLMTAAAVLALGTTAAAQQIDLRPRFEEGQELVYRLTQQSDQSYAPVDAHDQEQSAKFTQELDVRFKPVHVDDETRAATLEVSFDRVKMGIESGGVTNSFDSDAPDQGAFAGMLGAIKDLVLKVELDGDGNITSITGNESALGGGSQAALVGGLIGSDQLRARFGPILTLKKGDGRASVGEYWTTMDEFGSSPLGAFKVVTKHRLTGYRRGVATIETTGRMMVDSEGDTDDGPTLRSSEYTGEYTWDAENGRLQTLEVEQSSEIEASVGEKRMLIKSKGAAKAELIEPKPEESRKRRR